MGLGDWAAGVGPAREVCGGLPSRLSDKAGKGKSKMITTRKSSAAKVEMLVEINVHNLKACRGNLSLLPNSVKVLHM